jgi:arylsulfatase
VTTNMIRCAFLVAGAAIAVQPHLAHCKPATDRPNIIFLMDDQHRWDALGIVDPAVKTPNLDKLARNGIRYEDAVCQAPMCVPSRNSMMLGLYPNQVGILRNARGIPDSKLPARPLPELFRKAGY